MCHRHSFLRIERKGPGISPRSVVVEREGIGVSHYRPYGASCLHGWWFVNDGVWEVEELGTPPVCQVENRRRYRTVHPTLNRDLRPGRKEV